jgi:hypothetical protein
MRAVNLTNHGAALVAGDAVSVLDPMSLVGAVAFGRQVVKEGKIVAQTRHEAHAAELVLALKLLAVCRANEDEDDEEDEEYRKRDSARADEFNQCVADINQIVTRGTLLAHVISRLLLIVSEVVGELDDYGKFMDERWEKVSGILNEGGGA